MDVCCFIVRRIRAANSMATDRKATNRAGFLLRPIPARHIEAADSDLPHPLSTISRQRVVSATGPNRLAALADAWRRLTGSPLFALC